MNVPVSVRNIVKHMSPLPTSFVVPHGYQPGHLQLRCANSVGKMSVRKTRNPKY